MEEFAWKIASDAWLRRMPPLHWGTEMRDGRQSRIRLSRLQFPKLEKDKRPGKVQDSEEEEKGPLARIKLKIKDRKNVLKQTKMGRRRKAFHLFSQYSHRFSI
jgi:hypothetical protein